MRTALDPPVLQCMSGQPGCQRSRKVRSAFAPVHACPQWRGALRSTRVGAHPDEPLDARFRQTVVPCHAPLNDHVIREFHSETAGQMVVAGTALCELSCMAVPAQTRGNRLCWCDEAHAFEGARDPFIGKADIGMAPLAVDCDQACFCEVGDVLARSRRRHRGPGGEFSHGPCGTRHQGRQHGHPRGLGERTTDQRQVHLSHASQYVPSGHRPAPTRRRSSLACMSVMPSIPHPAAATRDDAQFIHDTWHERTLAHDIDGLLELYLPDATLESPLVPRTMDVPSGVLTGHGQLREFFERGTRGRPNDLVRFQRSGRFLFDGCRLVWEYPRGTDSDDQVDIAEVMDLVGPRIQHHRIYWGWFGIPLLRQGASR